MQNSNPPWARASRTGSESGGSRSEKRVFVNALLGLRDSASMAIQQQCVLAFLAVHSGCGLLLRGSS